MNKQTLSTFDRLMKNKGRKKNFDKEYKAFLLSELMLTLMEGDNKSVRNLAKEVGISPTVIQEIRSGKRANITLKNFVNIMKALGAEVAVKKGKNYFTLELAA